MQKIESDGGVGLIVAKRNPLSFLWRRDILLQDDYTNCIGTTTIHVSHWRWRNVSGFNNISSSPRETKMTHVRHHHRVALYTCTSTVLISTGAFFPPSSSSLILQFLGWRRENMYIILHCKVCEICAFVSHGRFSLVCSFRRDLLLGGRNMYVPIWTRKYVYTENERGQVSGRRKFFRKAREGA